MRQNLRTISARLRVLAEWAETLEALVDPRGKGSIVLADGRRVPHLGPSRAHVALVDLAIALDHAERLRGGWNE